MSLSSPNRSIFNTFRHIMPYSAPFCKGLIYSKTGVSWQMNSTFIIISIPLHKAEKRWYELVFRSISISFRSKGVSMWHLHDTTSKHLFLLTLQYVNVFRHKIIYFRRTHILDWKNWYRSALLVLKGIGFVSVFEKIIIHSVTLFYYLVGSISSFSQCLFRIFMTL